VHPGHITAHGWTSRWTWGGDRVAVGLVADQDTAEVVGGLGREGQEKAAESIVFAREIRQRQSVRYGALASDVYLWATLPVRLIVSM
jgi:hypothetical protein